MLPDIISALLCSLSLSHLLIMGLQAHLYSFVHSLDLSCAGTPTQLTLYIVIYALVPFHVLFHNQNNDRTRDCSRQRLCDVQPT